MSDDDGDFTEAVVRTFLRRYALAVRATEAIAFRVDRAARIGPSLHLITHIRPDECDEATRRAALRGFEEMATTCVEQGKPGAIGVGTPGPGEDPQFCLVVPVPNEPSARLLFALIVSATSEEGARGKLKALLTR